MATFEQSIHTHFDERVETLGSIKARSLGADLLTLTSLNVFVYGQLEGGMKDLASCFLRHLNKRNLSYGQLKPSILDWRNGSEIEVFRRAVNFGMIADNSPFSAVLAKPVKVRHISRLHELNQMRWSAIEGIYCGLGLSTGDIISSKSLIEQLVDERNNAAHHGSIPPVAATMLERQLRQNVEVVETVLTDFSLKLLPYFKDRLHCR
jgi:hypothetical protein